MKIKAITNKREFIFNTNEKQLISPFKLAKGYLDKGENLVRLIEVN